MLIIKPSQFLPNKLFRINNKKNVVRQLNEYTLHNHCKFITYTYSAHVWLCPILHAHIWLALNNSAYYLSSEFSLHLNARFVHRHNVKWRWNMFCDGVSQTAANIVITMLCTQCCIMSIFNTLSGTYLPRVKSNNIITIIIKSQHPRLDQWTIKQLKTEGQEGRVRGSADPPKKFGAEVRIAYGAYVGQVSVMAMTTCLTSNMKVCFSLF